MPIESKSKLDIRSGLCDGCEMNHAQYLLAQFGSRSEREFARSLLLESSEIPYGAWTTYDEKSRRSGKSGGKNSESEQRARKAGSFNAIRTYAQQGATKAVMIEVRQWATQFDAAAEAPSARLNLIPSPTGIGAILTEAQSIEPPMASVRLSARYFEQFIRLPDRSNTYRYSVDSVDRIVFLTAWITSEEVAPWEDVFRISSLQADRIRRILALNRLNS
jgi:hypothetical protein